MKIGILTLEFNSNYGGIMQNYALQTVLKRMGHEVYTINNCRPIPHLPLRKMPWAFTKRIAKKILGYRKGSIVFLEWKLRRDKLIVEQHVRRFINENIQLTKPIYSKEQLLEINAMGFDAVIVGSDQVWRVPYVYPDIQTYFLDFIKSGIKKMAYAASFGIDSVEYSEDQIKSCGILIKNFDFVSVREKSGLSLINNIYGWKCKSAPVHVLDPTMLLSKEDYINLSKNYSLEENGDLFYYILDMTEEKQQLLNKLSNDLGYKPFTVKSKKSHWLDNPYERITPPMEMWLQAFNRAKFIFTDSFHGCVFSIIFNKNFLAYGNETRGMSRFSSLMDTFELNDRLIYKLEAYNPENIVHHGIDWEKVNKIRRLKSNESMNLLRSFLHKNL